MVVKRSRIPSSSSFGETRILRQVLPPEAGPVNRQRRSAPAAGPATHSVATTASMAGSSGSNEWRSRVLMLSSPVPESDVAADRPPMGGFLERCHRCKRRFAVGSDIFMYRDFHAFCTLECRDMQIEMDKEAQKVDTTLKL